jgi:hypothetical protein
VDLYESLFAVIDELDRDGIDHALVGGLALAVHGAPRATTDIDLLVGRDALIAMKLAAGRAQDLADVERLREGDR